MRQQLSDCSLACSGSSVRSSTPAVPASSASSMTRASDALAATPISRPGPGWKAATRFSAGMTCGVRGTGVVQCWCRCAIKSQQQPRPTRNVHRLPRLASPSSPCGPCVHLPVSRIHDKVPRLPCSCLSCLEVLLAGHNLQQADLKPRLAAAAGIGRSASATGTVDAGVMEAHGTCATAHLLGVSIDNAAVRLQGQGVESRQLLPLLNEACCGGGGQDRPVPALHRGSQHSLHCGVRWWVCHWQRRRGGRVEGASRDAVFAHLVARLHPNHPLSCCCYYMAGGGVVQPPAAGGSPDRLHWCLAPTLI